jgi:predicted N-formylglutamate amidohydrolase
MIEIRQDLVRTPADISAWVARLTDAWEHLRRNAASLFADL